jgi:hypothetical protein
MSAARSVQINFNNQTAEALILPPNGASLSGGEWSAGQAPPSSISPNSQVVWQSESDGFMTGTEGSAVYVFQANAANSVTVAWDNPYAGSNTYSAVVNPQNAGYNVQCSTPDNDADNSTVFVTLSAS